MKSSHESGKKNQIAQKQKQPRTSSSPVMMVRFLQHLTALPFNASKDWEK
jgi:hypothetical protein